MGILDKALMGKRFDLGEIGFTQQIMEDLTGSQILGLLRRHATGDWGEVPREDAEENEFSVDNGYRILSSYTVNGEVVWVITEADRSSTTLLYRSEY